MASLSAKQISRNGKLFLKKKANIDVFVSSLLLDESYLTTSVLARALHIKTQKVAISPVYLTGVV